MPARSAVRRLVSLASALLAAALLLSACAAARSDPAAPRGFFAASGDFNSVAAVSARSAWAVGYSGGCNLLACKTLIARWNGTAWKRVASPRQGRSGVLYGIAATSARNAWAVGDTGSVFGGIPEVRRSLILRWNGTAWIRVPCPSPGRGALLYAVAATSARNAWAVGYTNGISSSRPLIVRWNGAAWTRVPAPNPGGGTFLTDVVATSASNAWAVGFTVRGVGQPLILRWNGAAWKRVPIPSLRSDQLEGVAATSARNAWAVGVTVGGVGRPLILRWNGTSWKVVPAPRVGRSGLLSGVTATSARDVWAVGRAFQDKTLIVHWNGSVWTRVASPSPPGGAELYGVAATSDRNAWAAGDSGVLSGGRTTVLLLHWNGRGWK